MAINVEFSLEVNAAAQKIWDILTDVEAWPRWQVTNFVKLSQPGPIKEGSTFVANLGGLKWDVRVIKAERPIQIAWDAQRPGLRGVHGWEFKEANGKTTVITRETMTGWLSVLAFPMVKKSLATTDEKWLADLKIRAEST